jgi:hypothetical protein
MGEANFLCAEFISIPFCKLNDICIDGILYPLCWQTMDELARTKTKVDVHLSFFLESSLLPYMAWPGALDEHAACKDGAEL